MSDKLFCFPFLMVYKEEDDEKNKILGLPSNEEERIIIRGEAEYPYYDFIGVEDRWVPTKESLENATNGEFDACVVKFANVPQMLVPWTKAKFKREYDKFVEVVKSRNEEQSTILAVSQEQLAEIFKSQQNDGKDSE